MSGQATPEPLRPDPAAVRLARLTTMDVEHGDPHYHHRVEDAVAVYLWAEANTRPGPGRHTVAYPSLNEAWAFLAEYRSQREATWSSDG